MPSAPNGGEPAGYRPPDLTLRGAEHVRRYLETDGEVGYEWNGVPILLLTSTGRKTARPRTSALIYGTDGSDYLVVASAGGADRHPAWYLNLLANPVAVVQVKARRIPVTAHTAAPEERERLWRIVNDYWPNYEVYQSRTDRPIPVVALRPE
ncbi:nitroreductase family deazaflavin-dependent oxidoreductase [Nocardia bovistercoris]|uniref:Nitroreductase family deazaflavin-dependent oxidoreductase n=1 Tax=Nocardia bovistercoris TaxID=2785916 RepID=A0A931I831_9NOCA|nr:nitroreductase family deazaflavin-dependent oxidoreductase [Nocardia bovistercoris]MBH0776594.1 nitroreductase family deazaflavin-dependent oxidoreductase [Nocardia bovistercoris]